MNTDERGYLADKNAKRLAGAGRQNVRVKATYPLFCKVIPATVQLVLTLFLAGLMLADVTMNCTDF